MSRHADPASVFLYVAGQSRGGLALRRTPKYLRFVVTGTDWKTLDALDQLDDTPAAGERVIVAEKAETSRVHLYGVRNGRRTGWYETMVTYTPVADPPADDVARDTAKYQAWCLAREGKPQPPGGE